MTQFFINGTKVLVNDGHIKIRSGGSSAPPPPPQQTVAGYSVSGAGNSLYNGTYCFYAINDGVTGGSVGSNIYKHQTNNLYIYFGGNHTWIGNGEIYGGSDGYYATGENDPITASETSWAPYSCCGTDFSGSSLLSVVPTTCYI